MCLRGCIDILYAFVLILSFYDRTENNFRPIYLFIYLFIYLLLVIVKMSWITTYFNTIFIE